MTRPAPAATLDGPLAGRRVIDVSTILAGPLACQILGDFGADVIKIEHPRGDPLRGHGPDKDGIPLWWKEVGRNKRTVGLNLSSSEGAEVFLELARSADVIVENFRPGTLERWGLGWDELSAVNPDLILVRITGYGQSGPYASRPAFGTITEAMSGFAHLTGEADGPPLLPAFGLADSIAAIAASNAACMALYHRDAAGGTGQVIDLSILEPIMTAIGPSPTVYDQTGVVEHRHGNRSTNNAPRNLYRTLDGHWVAVSSSADAIARRVLELVGHPEVTELEWFATGRGRAENVDLLDMYVGDWIADRSRDEVLREFERVGAAVGPVYTAADLVDDPQVKAREMLTHVHDDELGPVLMHNVMFKMSETPGRIRFTGRAIGADTDAVLRDAGLSGDRIAELRERNVIV